MALLDDVKQALRISASNTAFNTEVQTLVDAARLDLKQAGVSDVLVDATEPDALIKRAIITYAKANFGYDNPDAERFQQSYVMLKQHLSLYGGYRSVSDETQ